MRWVAKFERLVATLERCVAKVSEKGGLPSTAHSFCASFQGSNIQISLKKQQKNKTVVNTLLVIQKFMQKSEQNRPRIGNNKCGALGGGR